MRGRAAVEFLDERHPGTAAERNSALHGGRLEDAIQGQRASDKVYRDSRSEAREPAVYRTLVAAHETLKSTREGLTDSFQSLFRVSFKNPLFQKDTLSIIGIFSARILTFPAPFVIFPLIATVGILELVTLLPLAIFYRSVSARPVSVDILRRSITELETSRALIKDTDKMKLGPKRLAAPFLYEYWGRQLARLHRDLQRTQAARFEETQKRGTGNRELTSSFVSRSSSDVFRDETGSRRRSESRRGTEDIEEAPKLSDWWRDHQIGGAFDGAFNFESHPEANALKVQIDLDEARYAEILAGTRYQLFGHLWTLVTLGRRLKFFYSLMSQKLAELYAPKDLQERYSTDPMVRKAAQLRLSTAAGTAQPAPQPGAVVVRTPDTRLSERGHIEKPLLALMIPTIIVALVSPAAFRTFGVDHPVWTFLALAVGWLLMFSGLWALLFIGSRGPAMMHSEPSVRKEHTAKIGELHQLGGGYTMFVAWKDDSRNEIAAVFNAPNNYRFPQTVVFLTDQAPDNRFISSAFSLTITRIDPATNTIHYVFGVRSEARFQEVGPLAVLVLGAVVSAGVLLLALFLRNVFATKRGAVGHKELDATLRSIVETILFVRTHYFLGTRQVDQLATAEIYLGDKNFDAARALIETVYKTLANDTLNSYSPMATGMLGNVLKQIDEISPRSEARKPELAAAHSRSESVKIDTEAWLAQFYPEALAWDSVSVILLQLLWSKGLKGGPHGLVWYAAMKRLEEIAPDQMVHVQIALDHGIVVEIPVHKDVFRGFLAESFYRYLASWAYNLGAIYGSENFGFGVDKPGLLDIDRLKTLLEGDKAAFADVLPTRDLSNLTADRLHTGLSKYANLGRPVHVFRMEQMPLASSAAISAPAAKAGVPAGNTDMLSIGVDIGTRSAKIGVVNGNGEVLEIPADLAVLKTKTESYESGSGFVNRLVEKLRVIQQKTGKKIQGVGIGIPGTVDIAKNRPVTVGQMQYEKGWTQTEIDQLASMASDIATALGIPPDHVIVRNDMDPIITGVAANLYKMSPEFSSRSNGNFTFNWMGSGHGFQIAVNGTPIPSPTEGGHIVANFGNDRMPLFDTEGATTITNLTRSANNKGWRGNPVPPDDVRPIGEAANDPNAANHQIAVEVLRDIFTETFVQNILLVYLLTAHAGIGHTPAVLAGGGVARDPKAQLFQKWVDEKLRELGMDKNIYVHFLTDAEMTAAVQDPNDLGKIGAAFLILRHVADLASRSESREQYKITPEAQGGITITRSDMTPERFGQQKGPILAQWLRDHHRFVAYSTSSTVEVFIHGVLTEIDLEDPQDAAEKLDRFLNARSESRAAMSRKELLSDIKLRLAGIRGPATVKILVDEQQKAVVAKNEVVSKVYDLLSETNNYRYSFESEEKNSFPQPGEVFVIKIDKEAEPTVTPGASEKSFEVQFGQVVPIGGGLALKIQSFNYKSPDVRAPSYVQAGIVQNDELVASRYFTFPGDSRWKTEWDNPLREDLIRDLGTTLSYRGVTVGIKSIMTVGQRFFATFVVRTETDPPAAEPSDSGVSRSEARYAGPVTWQPQFAAEEKQARDREADGALQGTLSAAFGREIEVSRDPEGLQVITDISDMSQYTSDRTPPGMGGITALEKFQAAFSAQLEKIVQKKHEALTQEDLRTLVQGADSVRILPSASGPESFALFRQGQPVATMTHLHFGKQAREPALMVALKRQPLPGDKPELVLIDAGKISELDSLLRAKVRSEMREEPVATPQDTSGKAATARTTLSDRGALFR